MSTDEDDFVVKAELRDFCPNFAFQLTVTDKQQRSISSLLCKLGENGYYLLMIFCRVKMSYMADHEPIFKSVFAADLFSCFFVKSKPVAVYTVRQHGCAAVAHTGIPENIAASLLRAPQHHRCIGIYEAAHGRLICLAGDRAAFARVSVMRMGYSDRHSALFCFTKHKSRIEEDMTVDGLKRSFAFQNHPQVFLYTLAAVKVKHSCPKRCCLIIHEAFLAGCQRKIILYFVPINAAVGIHDKIRHAAGIESCKHMQHSYRFTHVLFSLAAAANSA